MDTKELRLGNCVMLSKDYQYVGVEIPTGTVCKVHAISLNSLYLECHVNGGTFYGEVPISMVEPISLTEGLLLKLSLIHI